MSKKRKVTVALPDGTTDTRTTARTYTHAVATRWAAGAYLAHLEAKLAYAEKSLADHAAQAAHPGGDALEFRIEQAAKYGRYNPDTRTTDPLSAEQVTAEWVAYNAARAEHYRGVVADAKAALVGVDAATPGPWSANHWCGRLDLAHKEAARIAKWRGAAFDIEIVEVK